MWIHTGQGTRGIRRPRRDRWIYGRRSGVRYRVGGVLNGYADQNLTDYRAFTEAIADGLEIETET